MATEKKDNSIQRAINIISQAMGEVNLVLVDHEEFRMRAETTFKTLINGFTHVNNLSQGIGVSHIPEQEPLTEVMGIDVTRPVQTKLPSADLNEIEAFQMMVNDVYEGFETRENKDIIESVERMVILGVAKKAGLTVTEAKEVNTQFVTLIKQRIKLQKENEGIKASGTIPKMELKEADDLPIEPNPEVDPIE